MKKIMAGFLFVSLLVGANGVLMAAENTHTEIQQLKQRVQELEKRVSELEKALSAISKDKTQLNRETAGSSRTTLQAQARERMQKDSQTFTPEQLREIETNYQVANRQWNTPEAKQSLEKLIQKYSNANRTGCAVLYLGQMSTGNDKEKYLKQAAEKYSDCFYGDGVQVGAFAHFCLAEHYRQIGKTAEANQQLQVLREKFPNAIDHQGRPLGAVIQNSMPGQAAK